MVVALAVVGPIRKRFQFVKLQTGVRESCDHLMVVVVMDVVLLVVGRGIVVEEQVRLMSQLNGSWIVGIGMSGDHFQVHISLVAVVHFVTGVLAFVGRGRLVVVSRRILHFGTQGEGLAASHGYFSIDTELGFHNLFQRTIQVFKRNIITSVSLSHTSRYIMWHCLPASPSSNPPPQYKLGVHSSDH